MAKKILMIIFFSSFVIGALVTSYHKYKKEEEKKETTVEHKKLPPIQRNTQKIWVSSEEWSSPYFLKYGEGEVYLLRVNREDIIISWKNYKEDEWILVPPGSDKKSSNIEVMKFRLLPGKRAREIEAFQKK